MSAYLLGRLRNGGLLLFIVLASLACSQMKSERRSHASAGSDDAVSVTGSDDVASLPPDVQELYRSKGWNQPYMGPAAGSAEAPAPSYDAEEGSPSKPLNTPPSAHSLDGFPDLDRWFVPAAYAAENKVSEKYLIRNGTLDIKLDSIDTGQAAAIAIAAKYGGTVTNTSIQKNSEGYRSGFVTLRVPAARFQQVWDDLMHIPEIEVLSQNIQTEDVGAEYVSSISRLKALTAEQATLRKMLDEALAVQRSRGLGEAYKVLLDTQARLSEVTQQIQGVEDRVKVMADQITRSTITLNMTENPQLPAAGPPDKFNWGLGATFNAAVRQLLETARAALQAVIYFFVTLQWVWWLLAFFILRWAWRYYRRMMASVPPKKPVVESQT